MPIETVPHRIRYIRLKQEAIVIGRLVSPGSGLHSHRLITGQASIGEVLGHEIQTVGKDGCALIPIEV
ncbi:MAG: hypothetical protein ACYCXP_10715 [Leptospirillum sp.]